MLKLFEQFVSRGRHRRHLYAGTTSDLVYIFPTRLLVPKKIICFSVIEENFIISEMRPRGVPDVLSPRLYDRLVTKLPGIITGSSRVPRFDRAVRRIHPSG